jgi:AcrR family transcriptional regulator
MATLERFVNATRRLLDDRSFDSITVSDIVHEADRTVGSFYARFEDKYAVLYVLSERTDERLRSWTQAFCDPSRWDDEPVAAFVQGWVQAHVASCLCGSALYRAFVVASAADERFRVRRADAQRWCADHSKTFLRTRANELRCRDIDRGADRVFELISMTVEHHLLFGVSTRTASTTQEALVADLTEQCCLLLGIDAGDTSGAGDVIDARDEASLIRLA